jgi:hypothetical protein
MANGSKQPTPNIGANGFIWLLVVAAGTIFVTSRPPLEGSRPPTVEKYQAERRSVQDVDARLWQDPFVAVAERLTRFQDLKPEICAQGQKPELKDQLRKDQFEDHCESPLKKFTGAQDLQVLVASVSGASYSENQEFRRRTRYAVLAGLNAEGFAPVEPQHIGFYWPGAKGGDEPAAGGNLRLPKVVPFEWFKRKSNERILLLWFDEDVLDHSPLQQFKKLLCQSLGPGSSTDWSKAAILGPQLSTTLRQMVVETGNDWSPNDWWPQGCAGRAPKFYVYSATADDATLVPEYVAEGPPCRSTGTCLDDFFLQKKKDVKLYRMVATDEALALAIKEELKLRGLKLEQKPYSNIALVSEWDTLYGQGLPKSVARCLGGNGCQLPNVDPLAGKAWLLTFKYLRGLDGQMPNMEGQSTPSSQKDTSSRQEKDSRDSAKPRPDAKPQDRAEGQSQFDYLRRLGDHMEEIDSRLRGEQGRGIQAVGILGSDLYDKLLVLQALRPVLPEALFFTTDLDALIMHPIALTSTRNLLVASSFGLQLRPDIQREIPPFRSSYQSAGFLATRTAIRSNADRLPSQLLPQPLVFEIGRSGLFQFARPGEDPSRWPSEQSRDDHDDCYGNLLKCRNVQPLATAMFPPASMAAAVLFAGLGLCLLITFPPLTRRIWARIDGFMRASTSHGVLIVRGILILAGLAAVISLVAGAIYLIWPPLAHAVTQSGNGTGQPMLLLEGMSLWPSIALRAVTLLLCIGLIVYGYILLARNLEKISQDLQLGETRERIATKQDTIVRENPPWVGFSSRFWYRLPDDNGSARSSDDRDANRVSSFWRMYIYQGYWVARIYRVLAATLAMALIWLSLWSVFGIPPVPARGSVSGAFYVAVTALLEIATLFLIALVADATLLTWRAVKAFRTEKEVWPEETLQQFSRRLGLPTTVLDNWIDLVFVSKRTKCITTLIYFPFVILALLVVSRSPLFANYHVNIPDVVTISLAFLIVIGCAIALRQSAEASRAYARRQLADQLIVARNANDGGRLAAQLELLLKRVEELHEGAFSPLSQQPLVRAMLLPLGSLGGTALLEYILLPGFS